MSLPFILYIFGQMSFIVLPANVLVVALVPLAGWLAWPAWALLNYMLDIAHWMAHLPHVFVQNLSLPLAGLLGLYAVVGFITIILWQRTKESQRDIITDMNQLETRGLET